jgi:hypothetical protein
MTEPNNPRRDEDTGRLPRCCQTWIVEQTRPRAGRHRTELPWHSGPAEAHEVRDNRGSPRGAAARPD